MTLRPIVPSTVATVVAIALAAPLSAQTLPADDGIGPPEVSDLDAYAPLPDPDAPPLFGDGIEGYTTEDYYWMERGDARWPDDLDPRDHEYMPSPEPNITFELTL